MRLIAFLTLVLLCACDSPSPWMAGAERSAITLDGFAFTVWRKENQVEIIRHGFARPEDQPRLRPLMIRAAQELTGCTVDPRHVEGDTGVLRARLRCTN